MTTEFESLSALVGRWTVDPTRGHLGFRVKAMWGLATANGHFTSYEGALQVEQTGAVTGALTVQAATLDTKNKKRDEHLRSADFFDVEQQPTIRFSPTAITPAPDGLTITGDLQVGATATQLQLPVTVSQLDDRRLRLKTSASVPRDKVGLVWNRAGMIRGDAHLDAEIDLVPA